MAFTLQSFVTDPTLGINGNVAPFVTDPTLAVAFELDEFVTDPTLAVHGNLAPFVTDPTLAVPFELDEFITAPTEAGPGSWKWMQTFTKSAVAVVGATGTSVKIAQYRTKSASAVQNKSKQLQYFTKSATGISGATGTMNKRMGAVSASGALSFIKTMYDAPSGVMVKTRPYFVRSITVVSGATGSSAKTQQLWQKSMLAGMSTFGLMSRSMSMWQKIAIGSIATGSTWYTFSMHAERQALTQYLNYQFNSFCVFNGKAYGFGDGGMFELTGATDNGTPIVPNVAGGVSDFGDGHLKTVDRVYVGYRSSGDIQFSVITHDDGKQYDYPLPSQGNAGIYRRRVVTGRGLRAQYYQWKLTGLNGASMAIDSVDINVTSLSRRIGGTDA